MSELLITPDNYQEYNLPPSVPSWKSEWKEAMRVNWSLNEYLDSRLPGKLDHGGAYASWLNSYGIYHQTKHGWWNGKAANRENIELYVLEQQTYSELFHDLMAEAHTIIQRIEKAGSFKARFDTVREIVETLTNQELPGITWLRDNSCIYCGECQVADYHGVLVCKNCGTNQDEKTKVAS